jgi:SAM-dependent methyltransferase
VHLKVVAADQASKAGPAGCSATFTRFLQASPGHVFAQGDGAVATQAPADPQRRSHTLQSAGMDGTRTRVRGLDALYRYRFPVEDRREKDEVWAVLCQEFFQRFVAESATMLDVGCGHGEFCRHIKAARKYAVDLNPEARSLVGPDVEFHQGDARDLAFLQDGQVDVAFASNFFEHLPDKSVMDDVLAEVRRVLRPGGLFVVLQPNIRLIPATYWDFYDHLIPLSDRSCAEAFAKAGFEISELVPRFLPYTTRSLFPKHRLLVRAYLRFRLAWFLFGKQLLIVGRRSA